MEMLMLGMVAVCGLVAMANWRQAVLLTIIVDALRDPLRKMTPGQPVWMSQIIVVLWAIVFVSCIVNSRRIFREVNRTFPRLKKGVVFFIVALIPGAFISVFMYRNGWLMAGIGGMSYLGPLAGMYIGVCFAERSKDVFRLMQIYVLVNSVVLVGSLAEQLGLGWQGLGGLDGHQWIRHMPGVLVRMVSGYFRSPDIAGFHAAHVVVFSILLAVPRKKKDSLRAHWLLAGIWGLFTLFLAGRRKMFAIPIVFLLLWVFAEFVRKQHGSKNLLVFVAFAIMVGGGGILFLVQGDAELSHHQTYLSTTLFDIAPLLYDHAFQDSLTTISQSGVLGSGLGVVTQGSQYAGVDRGRAWQEDGVSRLFKELGVVGVVLLLAAAFQFLKELHRAFGMPLQDTTRVLLQNGGIAIFVANVACFIASHQHISGDVSNGVLPLLFLGGVFGQVLGDRRTGSKPVASSMIAYSASQSVLTASAPIAPRSVVE